MGKLFSGEVRHSTTGELIQKFGFKKPFKVGGFNTYTETNGLEITGVFDSDYGIKKSENADLINKWQARVCCSYSTFINTGKVVLTKPSDNHIKFYLGFGDVKYFDKKTNYHLMYQGGFLSGTRNRAGYGESIYKNHPEGKKSYKGLWWDGTFNGLGLLEYEDGRIEKGIFRDGEFYRTYKFKLKNLQKDFKIYD